MGWSRPLASLLSDTESPRRFSLYTSSLVRTLALKLQADRHHHEELRRQADSKWQEGIRSLVYERSLDEQPPDVRALLEDVVHTRDRQQNLFSEDICRLTRVHFAAWEVSSRLKQHLKQEGDAWEEVKSAAFRAEAGLEGVGPELAERCAQEKERRVAFASATDRFRAGVEQLASQAESLTAQASRATDMAAQEALRMARIARGEPAALTEAPPLHAWAANLDSTARELRRLVSEVNKVPKLQPAEWIGLNQEALEALVGCGRSVARLTQRHDALLRAIAEWSSAHEADLRPLWQRLNKLGKKDAPLLEASGPSIASLVAELDAAAKAANHRVEAAVARAVQLLHTTM